MLKKRFKKGEDQVVVTFSLEGSDSRLPASVVGEFNGWDPAVHPLRRRSNGSWSVAVTLAKGRDYRFRYRSADGGWFNDDGADAYVANEHHSTDCVLTT
jgi:1,4-alpha-glucan branching enzyme